MRAGRTSGDTTTTLEESTHLAETRCSRRTTNTIETANNREKQSTHKFNEVQKCAYVLGARERDFIDSTINTTNIRGKLEGILEDTSGFNT